MLYSVVKDPVITATNLNHDLDIINKWAYQWKMQFNPDQAKEVLFSYKKGPQCIPTSSLMEQPSRKLTSTNTLVLILQAKLSFGRHLNEKMAKVKRIIGTLKHLSKFLP